MVTKINHRGRHQRRILGIDHSKIYNQYADEGQWRLRSVKRVRGPRSAPPVPALTDGGALRSLSGPCRTWSGPS